jgi:hypothetical protein
VLAIHSYMTISVGDCGALVMIQEEQGWYWRHATTDAVCTRRMGPHETVGEAIDEGMTHMADRHGWGDPYGGTSSWGDPEDYFHEDGDD